MKPGGKRALSALVVTVFALTGCTSKAVSDTTSSDGVKTGPGISKGRIQLAVATDLSGPFAATGTETGQAAKVFWKNVDANGGICGKFPVDVHVYDNGDNTQNNTQIYSQVHNNTLAFAGMLGAAQALALKDELAQDNMLVIVRSQGEETLGNPDLLITGTSFDIETANGIDYMLDQGKIKDGDTVGHVVIDGAFGPDVQSGLQTVAKKHDLQVVTQKVAPTATDMTPAVTAIAAKHPKLLVVSGTPPQLASVAAAAQAAGLDIPILATEPSWASSLLKSPSASYLESHLTVAMAYAPYEIPAASDFRSMFVKSYPKTDPSLQAVAGDSEGLVLEAILNQACKDGDLTRAGVIKARSELTSVDLKGIIPDAKLGDINQPLTDEVYITKAADVPGGLQMVQSKPYAGPDAQAMFAAKK